MSAALSLSLTRSARRGVLLALGALCLAQLAAAQSRGPRPEPKAPAPTPTPAPAVAFDPSALGVVEWLARMHAASRQLSYVGTFVVSAATGNLSSARIWHACEGDQQYERVEALSGPARSTFRRNEQVLTFLPEARVVRSEKRENLELFPNLLGAPESAIAELYGVRLLGRDRVAGLDADVVQLVSRDSLRFGYRIWSERRTGLVVKLQTLDLGGRVIEQTAFSELQLDAPIRTQALAQMMGSTSGYRIEKTELERTTPAAEGWALRTPVAGFKPMSSYRRAIGGGNTPERTMQWIFSDGLATVSLFVEPYDSQRQPQEAALAIGATHTLTRRMVDKGGDWWLTAVGEVPSQTLEAFAQGLARAR